MKIRPTMMLAMVIGVSWGMVVSGLGYNPITTFWDWLLIDVGGLILIFTIMLYIRVQESI